jgi:phosphate uptake regulator
VLETFEKALDGFFSLDPQTCRSVVEASTLAGELINGLNEESVRLLTESYPDRTDVYHAISILRFSTCQEQVVSHAVSVVKRTQRLLRLTPRSELPGLKPFAGDVFALLNDSCRMFLTNEPELGPLIRARHRSLEQFCAELKIYLTARMIADPSTIPGIVEIISCVGSLERVSHHALLITQLTSRRTPVAVFRHFPNQEEIVSVFNSQRSAP